MRVREPKKDEPARFPRRARLEEKLLQRDGHHVRFPVNLLVLRSWSLETAVSRSIPAMAVSSAEKRETRLGHLDGALALRQLFTRGGNGIIDAELVAGVNGITVFHNSGNPPKVPPWETSVAHAGKVCELYILFTLVLVGRNGSLVFLGLILYFTFSILLIGKVWSK